MVESIEDVRHARTGDRGAFARLYRRWSRPVFVRLVAILRSRDEAEDALQLTFLRAWRALPSLRDERRFAAWLFRIAGNTAKEELRRRRLRPLPFGDGEDLVGPRGMDSPEVEKVREVVASLRPVSRSILLLRCVAELSAEEVGAALSLSGSTVRRRLARILDHLRDGITRGVEDD